MEAIEFETLNVLHLEHSVHAIAAEITFEELVE